MVFVGRRRSICFRCWREMPIEYNRPGYREDFSLSGTFQGKCHCFVTACDSYQDIRVAGIHSGMHFEAVTPRWAHSWPIRSKQMQVGVQDVTIGFLHALCEFLCVCVCLDACKRGYARGKGMAFRNVSPDVLSTPFEPNVVVLQEVVLGGCRSIGFKMRSSRTVCIQGGWLYVGVVSCANLCFCPSRCIL